MCVNIIYVIGGYDVVNRVPVLMIVGEAKGYIYIYIYSDEGRRVRVRIKNIDCNRNYNKAIMYYPKESLFGSNAFFMYYQYSLE